MQTTTIKVNEISKCFKKKTILKGVSFTIYQGEVVGLIGVNGSGKSTLIKIVLGLLKADSGTTELIGSRGSDKIDKQKIGVVFDNHGLFPGFSVNKNLLLTARMKGCGQEDIDRVLEQVNMKASKDEKVKKLSYGMKQRVAIANALLANPEVVIMDEPTNGVDIHGIIEVRNIIDTLAKEGKTVILASHHLSELEKVCSRIIVMEQGQVKIDAPYEDVKKQYENLENIFVNQRNN